MPAHHRFHPYELQLIALYFSFVPGIAALALALGARSLERARRASKPVRLTRNCLPILLEKTA